MTQPEARKWFLEYNETHPKSLTHSLFLLEVKLSKTRSDVIDFIGDEYIEKAKNMPSKGQLEVLKLLDKGLTWSEIARKLGVSRQAVNITRRQLVNKWLIEENENGYEILWTGELD